MLARSMSVQEARRMYKKLFHIELLVKTGRANPSLALDFFFAEI
jgi:DNA polymerase III delta subunit